MNKKTRKIIILSVSCILVLLLIIFGIRTIIIINNSKKQTEQLDLNAYFAKYENEDIASYNPIYGLLNYTFDELNSSADMTLLNNTHMLHYSELNSEGIDSIYKSKYGVSKSEYSDKSNYIEDPTSNCYYNKNVLNDSSYDCNVCSKDNSEIVNYMYDKLEWDNIGEEEINNFCMKDAIYPIESNTRIFVDVYALKGIYNELTGKELELSSDITNSEYYQYGAFLADLNPGLDESIISIKSLEVKSINDDKIKCEYTALTDADNDIKGTVTLVKKEDGVYYILSNKNSLNNNI